MKTKLTLFALVIAITTNAAVLTVTNNPLGGAQYASLQAAYNAAVNNDTLLLEGTNLAYNLTTSDWAKPLVVIGIGFNPNKTNNAHTVFGHSSSGATTFFVTTLGSNSVFYGIDFSNDISSVNTSQTLTNYIFEDCVFNNTTLNFNNSAPSTIANMIFTNCVFTMQGGFITVPSSGSLCNITFTSCIFNGRLYTILSTTSSLLIDHCLFLTSYQYPIDQVINVTVQNSIFMNCNGSSIEFMSSNITYNNNIVRNAVTLPPAGENGSNNISGQDPMFVNCPANSYYAVGYNFRLQAGSPAIGAANDGTDIGLHGGYSHFSETGEVLINPIIRSLNVINSSVAPNGNLNVNINATKPTDN